MNSPVVIILAALFSVFLGFIIQRFNIPKWVYMVVIAGYLLLTVLELSGTTDVL